MLRLLQLCAADKRNLCLHGGHVKVLDQIGNGCSTLWR